jgi:hypothetical protein
MPPRELIEEQEVGICSVKRAVRRVFLCGRDPATGKNCDHRKNLIQKRLEFPAVSPSASDLPPLALSALPLAACRHWSFRKYL